MSKPILFKNLTDDQRMTIHKYLRLQPVDLKAEKRAKFRPCKTHIDLKPPIDIFTIETIDDEMVIRLPFRFASSLLKEVVNQDIEYPLLLNLEGEIPKYKVSLREEQVEPFMEAMEQLMTYGTTTLVLPTGFGKTILGICILYNLGLVGCILVQNTTLMDQWYKTIITSIPEIKDMIWIVGEVKPPSLVAVVICMNTRVSLLPKVFIDKIAVLIIDEAHLHCTPRGIDPILSFTPKYIVAMTATPIRNNGLETIIHLFCGQHCVIRDIKKPHTMIRFNTKIKFETGSSSRGMDFTGLCTQISKHEMRNLMIVQMVLGNMHRKFIVMTRRVEHVSILAKMFEHYGIVCDTLCGTKKTHSDAHVSILGISKAGVGYDYENKVTNYEGRLPDTLILAMSIAGDSSPEESVLFKQVIGRVRAKNPFIIYMVDSVSAIQSHFRSKKELIEKIGGVITEIDLNMYEPGCGISLPLL